MVVLVCMTLEVSGLFILIVFFQNFGWAFIFFLAASITDYLDGFLARKYNATSIIGEILDPIADKVIVIFLLFALSMQLNSFFIAFAGVILLIIIIFYIRSFFYKKKNTFNPKNKNKSNSNSNDTIIDAEYTVINDKDSDD